MHSDLLIFLYLISLSHKFVLWHIQINIFTLMFFLWLHHILILFFYYLSICLLRSEVEIHYIQQTLKPTIPTNQATSKWSFKMSEHQALFELTCYSLLRSDLAWHCLCVYASWHLVSVLHRCLHCIMAVWPVLQVPGEEQLAALVVHKHFNSL